jgi:hypothetical protein
VTCRAFTATVVLSMKSSERMFVAAAECPARSCSENVIGEGDVHVCEARLTRLDVTVRGLV